MSCNTCHFKRENEENEWCKKQEMINIKTIKRETILHYTDMFGTLRDAFNINGLLKLPINRGAGCGWHSPMTVYGR
jgi:hypothetical protein